MCEKIENTIVFLHKKTSATSKVWHYFGRLESITESKVLDENNSYCKLCYEEAFNDEEQKKRKANIIYHLSSTTGTGNFANHLRNKHKINIKELQQQAQTTQGIQKTLTGYLQVNAAKANAANAAKNSKYNRDLLLLWVQNNWSFLSIKSEATKVFLSKYISHYQLPDPTTLSRSTLQAVYDDFLSFIKLNIIPKLAPVIVLTLDMWSDDYKHDSYVVYTLHYVDDSFNLSKLVLDFSEFTQKHTADQIEKDIIRVLKMYGLENKKKIFVTDNGANVKAACDRMGFRIPCIGHALHNLITRDLFKLKPELEAIVKRCRDIYKKLR